MKVTLQNVRLSYPKLFKAESYEDGGVLNYSAAFIIEKGSDNDKAINAAIKAVLDEKFAKKAQAVYASIVNNPNKFAYRDGDTRPDNDAYAGKMFISAKRKQSDGAPKVKDRRGADVLESSGMIYGGCYVNAIIDLYAQDGQYTGLRCTLLGVQFVADGESFGGASKASDDDFTDLGDVGPDFSDLL